MFSKVASPSEDCGKKAGAFREALGEQPEAKVGTTEGTGCGMRGLKMPGERDISCPPGGRDGYLGAGVAGGGTKKKSAKALPLGVPRPVTLSQPAVMVRLESVPKEIT